MKLARSLGQLIRNAPHLDHAIRHFDDALLDADVVDAQLLDTRSVVELDLAANQWQDRLDFVVEPRSNSHEEAANLDRRKLVSVFAELILENLNNGLPVVCALHQNIPFAVGVRLLDCENMSSCDVPDVNQSEGNIGNAGHIVCKNPAHEQPRC